MHADILFVNKKPFLVSLTQPLGLVQVSCLDNASTPILRQSLRKMFGTIGSRGMRITKFTSDNEKGIVSLLHDMNALSVEVVTVGPGQHDHTIERLIRHLKEVIRTTIFSLPYQMPDILMPHLVVNAAKKLILFPSSTRTDNLTPFELFFGRKANIKLDIGPPFGSYCQVTNRLASNGMDPRTIGCLYLEPTMNGTGTHSFLRLDTRTVLSANHFIVLPVPDTVVAIVNGWAHTNKHHILPDPIFTLHDRVLNDGEEADISPPATPPPPQLSEEEPHMVPLPGECNDTTSEVRGDAPRNEDYDNEASEEQPTTMQDDYEVVHEGMGLDTVPDITIDITADPGTSPHAPRPPRPTPPTREPSTRVTKPVDRLNLMSIKKAARMFPEKSTLAMEAEVASLLGKQTFKGVHGRSLTNDQRKRILRSIMNITEKFLPTLNDKGVREIDKVKARLCVDGRAQSREDYLPEEVESPTASIASIFAVAQIAAMERRFIMVGDVGTAYLNARMPLDDPDKILHMRIEATVATIIVRQDKAFKEFIAPDGSLTVRLEKALYGCIESARLWYTEISSTLHACGFVTNPRDPCVHNKMVGRD